MSQDVLAFFYSILNLTLNRYLVLKIFNSDSRNSDSMKRTAQRKLEYFSLDKLTAQSQQQPSNSQKSPSESHPNQSHKPQHHSIKHESPDVPKRVHIQRYLQQLGLAEHPVQQPVKEAWTEGLQQEPQSLTPPKTQSTPLSARTSPGTPLLRADFSLSHHY